MEAAISTARHQVRTSVAKLREVSVGGGVWVVCVDAQKAWCHPGILVMLLRMLWHVTGAAALNTS
jgi:hypothetical protein